MTDFPITEFDTLQGILDLVSDRIPITPDELSEVFAALGQLQRWCENESAACASNFDAWRQSQRELEALYTLV